MIQRIRRQLEAAGLLGSAVIVTHASQTDSIQNHIGDRIPLLSEPHKRGTFHAVALATAYFHNSLNLHDDELIAVIPADMYAEQSFFHLLQQLPRALKESGAELGLIGCQPRSPSSQYGYIVPGKAFTKAPYTPISCFVEKPEESRAAALIARQALWNCGVFAFRLGFLVAALKERELPLDAGSLLARYPLLPVRSIDEEIAEQTRQAIVLPYDGMWNDLGSWPQLTAQLDSSQIGPGRVSQSSGGSFLVNELHCPVHLIDVPDVIVAASPDGILVASLSNADAIKQQLPEGDALPWYEEKRWGDVRTLDVVKAAGGMESWTRKVRMQPGTSTSYHVHARRRKIWTVLSGSGLFIRNGRERKAVPGTVLDIPCGTKHGMCSDTGMEWMEVQLGEQLTEDDTLRISMTCGS